MTFITIMDRRMIHPGVSSDIDAVECAADALRMWADGGQAIQDVRCSFWCAIVSRTIHGWSIDILGPKEASP